MAKLACRYNLPPNRNWLYFITYFIPRWNVRCFKTYLIYRKALNNLDHIVFDGLVAVDFSTLYSS